MTESEHKKHVQQIKDYILNNTENSIKTFHFECIAPLKYLSQKDQLDKLNIIINKFYNLLNTGFPFVAYLFQDKIFNEEDFFSHTPTSIMDKEGNIYLSNLESNKAIQDACHDYARAKFLEIALREKDLILDYKAEPLDSPKTEPDEIIIVVKEQCGEMFSNNGFILFEHILNEYIKPKNTRGRYEDLSYYYRRLLKDGFIHQKIEPFRHWFINKYTEEFSKIKILANVANPQRNKNYSNALDWFKTQNK